MKNSKIKELLLSFEKGISPTIKDGELNKIISYEFIKEVPNSEDIDTLKNQACNFILFEKRIPRFLLYF